MQTIPLDGQWRMLFDSSHQDWSARHLDDSHWQLLTHLPPDQTVWLRQEFYMPPNENCSVWWLEAEGLGYQCEVWVNGQWIGEHLGGLMRFRWDVTAHVELETNVIAVRVSPEPAHSRSIYPPEADFAPVYQAGLKAQLTAYDCQHPPQTDDWYAVSARPLLRVDPKTLTWWRGDAPFFPRGITYRPSRSSDFERDILAMRDANLNMIHISGEILPDEFYTLCDEFGIFVWQDFPFAIADVDWLRPFEEMLLQLRSHPCLAAWGVPRLPARRFLVESLLERAARLDPHRYVHFYQPEQQGLRPQHIFYHETEDALKFWTEAHRAAKHEAIAGMFYHRFQDLRGEDGKLGADYNQLRNSMQTLLPIARVPLEWYSGFPLGEPLSFAVAILNDSPERFTDWHCKISLTSWIPSSQLAGEATYMYHWKHTFDQVSIDPCSRLDLGEVTMPPLHRPNAQYQLVLQMYHLDNEQTRALANTYILTSQS